MHLNINIFNYVKQFANIPLELCDQKTLILSSLYQELKNRVCLPKCLQKCAEKLQHYFHSPCRRTGVL